MCQRFHSGEPKHHLGKGIWGGGTEKRKDCEHKHFRSKGKCALRMGVKEEEPRGIGWENTCQ